MEQNDKNDKKRNLIKTICFVGIQVVLILVFVVFSLSAGWKIAKKSKVTGASFVGVSANVIEFLFPSNIENGEQSNDQILEEVDNGVTDSMTETEKDVKEETEKETEKAIKGETEKETEKETVKETEIKKETEEQTERQTDSKSVEQKIEEKDEIDETAGTQAFTEALLENDEEVVPETEAELMYVDEEETENKTECETEILLPDYQFLAERVKYTGTNSIYFQYEVDNTASEYIERMENWFTSIETDEKNKRTAADSDWTYSDIIKNIEKYEEQLIAIKKVDVTKVEYVSIKDEATNVLYRATLLEGHDSDDEEARYVIYIDQKISDISEGDCINIYALPIGAGSVGEEDNRQEALVVLCCYVKKTSNIVGNITGKITDIFS